MSSAAHKSTRAAFSCPVAYPLDIYMRIRYNTAMIKSFADRETEKVYHQFFSSKLPQAMQRTALRKLIMIDNAAFGSMTSTAYVSLWMATTSAMLRSSIITDGADAYYDQNGGYQCLI